MGTTDVRKKATTVSLCECFRKNFPNAFFEVRSSKCFPCYYSRATKTFPPTNMLHCVRPVACRRLVSAAAARRERRKSSHTSIQTKIFAQSLMSGAREVLRGGRWLAGAWICLLDDRRTRDVSSIQQCGVCYWWCGDKTRKARGATPSGMKAFLSFGQAPGVGCYFSVASLSCCWLVFI